MGFDVYIGVRKKDNLHVDLVVNAVITDEVEIAEPGNALELPKLPSNPYRLYPVVDQIADEVCATVALYNGHPSSREKDLVELVVLATTQDVEANKLLRALDVEAGARSLPLPRDFDVPASWGTRYAKLASKVPACVDFRTVELASGLMRAFIDPVLCGKASSLIWSPESLAWRGAS